MSPKRSRNEFTRTPAESQDRLAGIIASIRRDLDDSPGRLAQLEGELPRAEPARGPAFGRALRGDDVAVIAEVKRRSPSQGRINESMDAVDYARRYTEAGARAVSVVTESAHFGGSLRDLERVAGALSIPTLRKDFILHRVQLLEARLAGAAAVLLLARVLEDAVLSRLNREAQALGLATFLEVHGERELHRAMVLDPAPSAIGVNARDLTSFAIDLSLVDRLLPEIPPGMIAVAESGLETRVDVERVAKAGADAVLVGTLFASSPDPGPIVRGLTGVRRRGR